MKYSGDVNRNAGQIIAFLAVLRIPSHYLGSHLCNSLIAHDALHSKNKATIMHHTLTQDIQEESDVFILTQCTLFISHLRTHPGHS